MLPFVKVGIVAGSLQLITVALVSCLVLAPSTLRALVVATRNEATPAAELVHDFLPLKWLFLVLAVGIVLTDTKHLTFAATAIRNASRLMRPTVPDHAATTLFVLLVLPTAAFAILTLQQPPDFVIALSGYWELSSWFWITWSALMSVGVAFCGAITHAAWRAAHADL
jgi:hypothetical protein